MSYFKICPLCKGHLDPGEVCDCRKGTEDGIPRYRAGEGNPGETGAGIPVRIGTLPERNSGRTERIPGNVGGVVLFR